MRSCAPGCDGQYRAVGSPWREDFLTGFRSGMFADDDASTDRICGGADASGWLTLNPTARDLLALRARSAAAERERAAQELAAQEREREQERQAQERKRQEQERAAQEAAKLRSAPYDPVPPQPVPPIGMGKLTPDGMNVCEVNGDRCRAAIVVAPEGWMVMVDDTLCRISGRDCRPATKEERR